MLNIPTEAADCSSCGWEMESTRMPQNHLLQTPCRKCGSNGEKSILGSIQGIALLKLEAILLYTIVGKRCNYMYIHANHTSFSGKLPEDCTCYRHTGNLEKYTCLLQNVVFRIFTPLLGLSSTKCDRSASTQLFVWCVIHERLHMHTCLICLKVRYPQLSW